MATITGDADSDHAHTPRGSLHARLMNLLEKAECPLEPCETVGHYCHCYNPTPLLALYKKTFGVPASALLECFEGKCSKPATTTAFLRRENREDETPVALPSCQKHEPQRAPLLGEPKTASVRVKKRYRGETALLLRCCCSEKDRMLCRCRPCVDRTLSHNFSCCYCGVDPTVGDLYCCNCPCAGPEGSTRSLPPSDVKLVKYQKQKLTPRRTSV